MRSSLRAAETLTSPRKRRKRASGPGTLINAATRTPHAYVGDVQDKSPNPVGKLPQPRVGGKVPGIGKGGWITGITLDSTNGTIYEEQVAPDNAAPLLGQFLPSGTRARFKSINRIFHKVWLQGWLSAQSDLQGIAPSGNAWVRFYLNGFPQSGYVPFFVGTRVSYQSPEEDRVNMLGAVDNTYRVDFDEIEMAFYGFGAAAQIYIIGVAATSPADFNYTVLGK